MLSSVRKDRTHLHAYLLWKLLLILLLPAGSINSFNYLCFLSCFQQLISSLLILYNKSTLHYPWAIWFLWSSVFSCVPHISASVKGEELPALFSYRCLELKFLAIGDTSAQIPQDAPFFSGLVWLWKNRDLWSFKFPELFVPPSCRRMWQWGTQREIPLSALNSSRSLLWRKDCSLTADEGTIHLQQMWEGWQRKEIYCLPTCADGPEHYFGQVPCRLCSAAHSWHCRAAAFSPPDIPSARQKLPK